MQADPVYGVPSITGAAMWFRSLVLATALVSVSLPALARGELSDTRKWKVLLPTVRAATDCIARGIAASPTALTYARQENWLEAIKSTVEECRSVGSRLIAEHDRLYGPGTGKTFVEGPYATDLPRAVKARIGPVLGRVAAELVKTAEDVSGPVAVETGTPRQVASPPLRLQSDALDRKDDLVPVLDARSGTEIARETVRPANADNPTVPTVVAGSEPSVPVQVAPSLLRTDAPEQEDLRLRVSVPTETAVRDIAGLAEQPAAPVDAPAAELRLSAASLAPAAIESRSDRPTRWGLAHTFVLLGLLALAALYRARRARPWTTGKPQERPVLPQARRNQKSPGSGRSCSRRDLILFPLRG